MQKYTNKQLSGNVLNPTDVSEDVLRTTGDGVDGLLQKLLMSV